MKMVQVIAIAALFTACYGSGYQLGFNPQHKIEIKGIDKITANQAEVTWKATRELKVVTEYRPCDMSGQTTPGPWQEATKQVGSADKLVISGLAEDQHYEVRVRPMDDAERKNFLFITQRFRTASADPSNANKFGWSSVPLVHLAESGGL